MRKLLIGLACLILVISSCKKKSGDQPQVNQPTTYEELLKSSIITNQITATAKPIINNEINSALASNAMINVSSIIDKLKAIDGVKNIAADDSGSSLLIQQTDGAQFRIWIQTKNDDRFYPKTGFVNNSIPVTENKPHILSNQDLVGGTSFPAIRKALILAPFQTDFNTDLVSIKSLFESAGYTVKVLLNNDAILDVFRGDYLADYGVIYISTHGSPSTKLAWLNYGIGQSSLLTGQVYDEKIESTLPSDLKEMVGHGSPAGDLNKPEYFEVTPDYIEHTLTKRFQNSWIFLDACNSATSGDFQSMFIKNGAGGFTGYTATMRGYFANIIAVEVVSLLTNGEPLSFTKDNLMADSGIKKISLASNAGENIASLYCVSSDNAADFSLRPFDRSGSMICGPSYGYLGDKVFYGVRSVLYYSDPLNNGYNKIKSVSVTETDIAQSYQLNDPYPIGLSAGSWQIDNVIVRGRLQEIYPQVKTTIYKSIDANGNILETGSSTYTILGKKP